MIKRLINLPFKKKSVFLFGPRQVGKSTLVRHILKDNSCHEIDLLRNEVLKKYKTNPEQIRSEVEYLIKDKKQFIVFIDEIQKCPELLDEVHFLIEQYKPRIFFILTGSSARKLKRASVNMLGGRAWQYFLFPFIHVELGNDFSLDSVLFKGSLPPVIHESDEDAFKTLRSYVQTYLKEEILDEAIVRNIGAFNRFFDIAADQSGQTVNFSTIARDTGVSSKTIKGYYQILEDTLIALKLEPYIKSARKRIVKHPKYYLFDIGVINASTGRISMPPAKGTTIYGILFEHFVILETFRLINYSEKPYKMFHWRSSNGAEVDLIIESPETLWAVEIKSSPMVKSANLSGLKSFIKDYPNSRPVCVCTCDTPYMAGEITVINWEKFFGKEFLGLLGDCYMNKK